MQDFRLVPFCLEKVLARRATRKVCLESRLSIFGQRFPVYLQGDEKFSLVTL